MVSSVSDWLCNVMVWGAIVAFAALLYDSFVARGFLADAANPISGAIAVVVVVVLSALWPRY